MLVTIPQLHYIDLASYYLLPGFKVLTEPERNASVHSVLQHCTQDQLRFFHSLIATMIKQEEPKPLPGKR